MGLFGKKGNDDLPEVGDSEENLIGQGGGGSMVRDAAGSEDFRPMHGRYDLPSRADQESYSDDPQLTAFRGMLSEVRTEEVRRGRMGWGMAGLFFVLFIVMFTAYYKLGQSVVNFRFPFIRADGNGSVVLVQSIPESEKGEYPVQNVRAEIKRFYEERYGISQWHARKFWPELKAYWLGDREKRALDLFAQTSWAKSEAEGWMRKITVVMIVIDDAQPIKSGGTSWLARVQYVEEDIRVDGTEPLRKQSYESKIRFTTGTKIELTNPDAKKLYGDGNPLNFRVVELQNPEPLTSGGQRGGAIGPDVSNAEAMAPVLGEQPVPNTPNPSSPEVQAAMPALPPVKK
jgi:hypothetical protein